MNMFNFKFFKKALLCATFCVTALFTTSCTDEIAEENRFTWTGELISTYLEKNPENFSSFVTILKKANISKKAQSSLFKTLSTYGSYTCFAPTNDAVYKFLEELSADPERTKVYSTDVELLDDSVATEIAKNHIIEKAYKTIDIPDGNFPKNTMNRRVITMSSVTGKIVLDETSTIVEGGADIETENGVIHAIDKVLNPSDKKIHEQILQYKEYSLFGQALIETGLTEILDLYKIDPEYENMLEDHGGKLPANKYINYEGEAYAPVERRQRYTVLLESDDLLANPDNNHKNWEIRTLADLEKLAQEFYGTDAPGEYTNPNNALHKYMQYHIIDRQLFYEGSAPGGFIMEGYYSGIEGFSSEINLPTTNDRYDYFETLLPYSMIKVTRPFTNELCSNSLVINYAQENGTFCTPQNMGIMEKYMNISIIKQDEVGIEDFNNKALNGTLHPIDKILVYDEDEMRGNILNERMRWDVSSFFPEMTNNYLRWEENASHRSTYIPDGYCERLRVNGVVDNTVIIYIRPSDRVSTGGYPNYQGDEFIAIGRYDFKYRIPHVPVGTYEIRFGYSYSTERAITQFYYDDKVCGIPVDMALTTDNPLIGWFEEKEMDEDLIKENDKAMRNRGYMKGPASCVLNKDGDSMRKSAYALRKIVGTFNIDKRDHWLRFKNVTENEKTASGNWVQFNQDYLEIVPTSIISNPAKPEDQN